MTLFETLQFLISKSRTEGLLNKIKTLYAGNKLSKEEYETLTNALAPTNNE